MAALFFRKDKSWLHQYHNFRSDHPLPDTLPSKGVKVTEDSGLHNDMEQAIYYFLQPTGLLYGATLEPAFPETGYPMELTGSKENMALLVFVDSLLACMVADRSYILEGLVEEENRTEPAMEIFVEYFLGGPERGVISRAAWNNPATLVRVEKRIKKLIAPGGGVMETRGLLHSGFLFLDLYHCLLWQREKAMDQGAGPKAWATIQNRNILQIPRTHINI